MARNYFSADTSVQDAGNDAWNTSQARWDQSAKQRAGYRAAPQIAQGNYRGAAQAYAGEGMAPEAQSMMHDQNTVDQQGYERQRQMTADQLAAAEKRLEHFSTIAEGIATHAPEGQRMPLFEKAKETLRALGMPDAELSGITEAQLTNAALGGFVKDLKDQWQMVKGANGEVGAYRSQPGSKPEYMQLQAPTQRAPVGYQYDAEGHLQIDPGYVEGQGQVSDARAAATARHRAPPRGRAGAGGKPAAEAPRPTGRRY